MNAEFFDRQGAPRKRKGPITGTKGTERFRSEEPFYVNPLPDCLCQDAEPPPPPPSTTTTTTTNSSVGII